MAYMTARVYVYAYVCVCVCMCLCVCVWVQYVPSGALLAPGTARLLLAFT